MNFGHVTQGLRARAFAVGRTIDRRGGWTRHGARFALGILHSARDTLKHRTLRTVRWSPRDELWIHRWPEGKVADATRWREWRDWVTGGGVTGGGYDLDDLLFRHYRPAPGDVVVDIGAGHGGETFALAHMVGEKGRVISIEAAPGTYGHLKELSRLNGWQHVETIQAAVADRPGTMTMSTGDSWVVANLFEPGDTQVPAVTLDDLCHERGITRIDWLKMNIEGAEKEALRGMENIAPAIRNVTISCHDFLGTEWARSKAQVMAWLVQHGFTVREHGDGEPWARDYVYAWREPAAH